VCESAKIFLTSKISYLLFSNPTHETKLGLQIGGRLLYQTTWTNHYDWPIRNRDQQPQHIYYTLLWQLLLGFAGPFTSLSKLCKNAGQNYFAEPNYHVLIFLHPILILQDHILSTDGVALNNESKS
jgi:hypothetical protein